MGCSDAYSVLSLPLPVVDGDEVGSVSWQDSPFLGMAKTKETQPSAVYYAFNPAAAGRDIRNRRQLSLEYPAATLRVQTKARRSHGLGRFAKGL